MSPAAGSPTWGVSWEAEGSSERLSRASTSGSAFGQPFQVSAGGAISLSFDPTGRLLATAGTDATVRIFDVSEPGRPTPFGPPTLPATSGWTSARFTADGSSLVVLDQNGQAWVWPMRWQEWASHACEVADSQLSRAEWSEFLGGRPYAPVCPMVTGTPTSG